MMKRDHTQKSERLFAAFGELDPAMVREAEEYTPRVAQRPLNARRLVLSLAAALLCAALLTLTVFAAVPALRGMLNLPFFDDNERQNTVPEGWVGIYTVDDLNAIRHDLDGKYILMNDITFADGDAPFIPIGSVSEPFMGQLDGNGYVIRGLVIEMAQETPALLFKERSDASAWSYYDVNETMTETLYVGLFGYCGGAYAVETPYRGMISNLGIEGARITVTNASKVSVGVLAGTSRYLAGCYVKDSEILVIGYTRAASDEAKVFIRAGGLIGTADLVDSCYASRVSVTVTGLDVLDASPYACLLGGLAGNAYTLVTSYTESCIASADSDQVTAGEIYGHVQLLHRLLNQTQFMEVYENYYRATHGMSAEDPLPENWKVLSADQNPEAAFLCRKFRSYYVDKSLGVLVNDLGYDFNNMDPAFAMGEFNPEYTMYLLDPALLSEELMTMEEQLIRAMGAETLAEIMTCDNMKIGPLGCYVLAGDEDYAKVDFAEFDFDSIWRMEDGRPVLRIFS